MHTLALTSKLRIMIRFKFTELRYWADPNCAAAWNAYCNTALRKLLPTSLVLPRARGVLVQGDRTSKRLLKAITLPQRPSADAVTYHTQQYSRNALRKRRVCSVVDPTSSHWTHAMYLSHCALSRSAAPGGPSRSPPPAVIPSPVRRQDLDLLPTNRIQQRKHTKPYLILWEKSVHFKIPD